jgi:hypothetical protein
MATATEGREKSQITGLRDGHDILSLPWAPNHNVRFGYNSPATPSEAHSLLHNERCHSERSEE